MRASRSLPWLLLGAGVVTLLALTLFGAQQPPPTTHSSTSDAADGTSALAKAAAEAGHAVDRLQASPRTAAGLLFIFSPNLPFTADEASDVARYARDGGVVVYASETADFALDGALGLERESSPVHDVIAFPPGPLLPGVHEVSGGADGQPFAVQPNQVPLLRGPRQEVLALEAQLGRGLVVALSDPLILCNGYILRSDNARFTADLLGLAPAHAAVAFDESHHVSEAEAPATQPAGGAAPWIAAIFWAVAILYVGLALRGRAFGPTLPLAPARARSSAEYVDAVSTLLRRSGGRRQALDILAEASRRALRGRRQTAESEAELARLSAPGELSEAELLDTARRLHELAYPEARR
jgi:uncharacterized protein DUF4350